MKKLDVYLQNVRIKKVRPYVRKGDAVLDIGTDDGTMFRRWEKWISYGVGLDPKLETEIQTPKIHLIRGYFPDAVPPDQQFDCVTLLAVLEHLQPEIQATLAFHCAKFLKPRGRVLITVPSPQVDLIAATLHKIGVLDGQSLEEHYGYDVRLTSDLFTQDKLFRQLRHSSFQCGLNHLFVFEKIAA